MSSKIYFQRQFTNKHIQSNFSTACDIVFLINIVVIVVCSLVSASKLKFRLTIAIT